MPAYEGYAAPTGPAQSVLVFVEIYCRDRTRFTKFVHSLTSEEKAEAATASVLLFEDADPRCEFTTTGRKSGSLEYSEEDRTLAVDHDPKEAWPALAVRVSQSWHDCDSGRSGDQFCIFPSDRLTARIKIEK